MAVLALVWATLVAYELVAPAQQRDKLRLVRNVLWAIFVLEFLLKLVISAIPCVAPALAVLLFALSVLGAVRIVASLRALRLLPASRVLGPS